MASWTQAARQHAITLWIPALVVGLSGALRATAASDGGDTFATGTFWLDLEASPDLDGDGVVGEGDLMLLVASWENCDPELLALLVAQWGVPQ